MKVVALWVFVSMSLTGCIGGSNDALVSWDIPVARENGQALQLSEIKGFNVYYSMGVNEPVVYFVVGPVNELLFTELLPGMHSFQVTTVTTDGLESSKSNKVSKQTL